MLIPVAPADRPDGSDGDLLHDDNLRGVFAGLNTHAALVLAVSGGPDSMALLRLAVRWAAIVRDRAPKLYVATVDHGLRLGSAADAALVAATAANLRCAHATLMWEGPKPTTRVQERARDARYALLVAHARAVGAGCVLTAHHADDQAETVLMRLGRGSGICGLAGMERESALTADIKLVRPLLEVSKRALVTLCQCEGQDFVEDPSNSDPSFARAYLRANAAAAARLGLTPDSLRRLARRMGRAEIALEAETNRLETLLTPQSGERVWRARLPSAPAPPPELLLRLLRRAISHAGSTAPRLERLEALTEGLAARLAAGQPFRGTLGGARIVLDSGAELTVTPEPLRRRGARGSEIHAGTFTAVIKATLTR